MEGMKRKKKPAENKASQELNQMDHENNERNSIP